MTTANINPHQIIRQIEAYIGQSDALVNLLDKDAKLRGSTKKIHVGIDRMRQGLNRVSETAHTLYEPTPGAGDDPASESLLDDGDFEPLPFDAISEEDVL